MKYVKLSFSFYFLIFMFCLGCDPPTEIQKETRIIYSKKLIKAEKILEIKIDNQTPNISTGIAYYKESKSWLFNLNHYSNEIQMYDLNEKTLHKSLKFSYEGDEGVGKIFGFHVHNLDSIFLFPQNSGTIYITDTTQLIKKRINYKIPKGHTPAFVLTSHFASPPIVLDDKIIVKTRPSFEYINISNEELSSTHFTFSIDLDDGETILLPHLYPNNYLSDKFKVFDFSFAASPKKMVYSLFADHNLYYSNSRQSALKAINAPSKYIRKDFPEFLRSGSRLESYKYFATSPHYKSLIYDKYRGVYYRFCYPYVETEDEKEILKLRYFPKLFSIMILDNSLNVIGETLIDDSKYLPNIFFITEEGLYLSINHPENPDNKEDYLSFALFTMGNVKL